MSPTRRRMSQAAASTNNLGVAYERLGRVDEARAGAPPRLEAVTGRAPGRPSRPVPVPFPPV